MLISFTHTDGGSKVGMHQLNQIWRGRERDKTVELVMIDSKNHVVSPVPQTYNLGIVGTPPIEIVIWGMVWFMAVSHDPVINQKYSSLAQTEMGSASWG